MNRDYVGRDAAVLAKGIGLEVPTAARLLWGEVPNDHPLVWAEQLMPVLPVTVVRDVDSAIDLAYQAEGGNHHSAAMYSTHVGNLTRMGRRMQCSIYVKNAADPLRPGDGRGLRLHVHRDTDRGRHHQALAFRPAVALLPRGLF